MTERWLNNLNTIKYIYNCFIEQKKSVYNYIL